MGRVNERYEKHYHGLIRSKKNTEAAKHTGIKPATQAAYFLQFIAWWQLNEGGGQNAGIASWSDSKHHNLASYMSWSLAEPDFNIDAFIDSLVAAWGAEFTYDRFDISRIWTDYEGYDRDAPKRRNHLRQVKPQTGEETA